MIDNTTIKVSDINLAGLPVRQRVPGVSRSSIILIISGIILLVIGGYVCFKTVEEDKKNENSL
jgi:hypothetical protein